MVRARAGTMVLVTVACAFMAHVTYAQLNTTFSDLFNEVLVVRLQKSGSPGLHGSHFLASAAKANAELVPGLNSLIAGNISSFPLSATSAGILFDFSTGQPVPVTESLGPIFAENAKTLGRGKLQIGVNYTFQDLDHFRGLSTDQMTFTFTHLDVTQEGTLGESPNESDIIVQNLDLHVRSHIGVVYATYGLTQALDVSLALPVISVSLSGTSEATISSYTFPRLGHANHLFGGDTLNPVLSTSVPYDRNASGIGDLAFRVKYNFVRGAGVDFAALLDVRFPTGKEEDFLGSGKPTILLYGILSNKFGDLGTHLNLGYARKNAELQSDAILYKGGFDAKLLTTLTFAMDILGQVDLNKSEAIHLAPGSVTIVDRVPGGQTTRIIPSSNIPDADADNNVALSVGFRFAPSDNTNILLNALVPLNSAGLRAPIAPTVGVSILL
jgi:hypothetical protein